MVRAAAKNHRSVAIVTDPAAYGEVLAAVCVGAASPSRSASGSPPRRSRTPRPTTSPSRRGAPRSSRPRRTGWPEFTGATWERRAVLRYGENPHQQAALYAHWRPGLASAEQLHGKEMSYNNYVDADAAVRAAHDHGDQPTVAIIKHANPCGIAVGATIADAYAAAHACDPVSAYGGIIATNRPVTRAMALAANETFSEVIVAPDFDADALEVLRRGDHRVGVRRRGNRSEDDRAVDVVVLELVLGDRQARGRVVRVDTSACSTVHPWRASVVVVEEVLLDRAGRATDRYTSLSRSSVTMLFPETATRSLHQRK